MARSRRVLQLGRRRRPRGRGPGRHGPRRRDDAPTARPSPTPSLRSRPAALPAAGPRRRAPAPARRAGRSRSTRTSTTTSTPTAGDAATGGRPSAARSSPTTSSSCYLPDERRGRRRRAAARGPARSRHRGQGRQPFPYTSGMVTTAAPALRGATPGSPSPTATSRPGCACPGARACGPPSGCCPPASESRPEIDVARDPRPRPEPGRVPLPLRRRRRGRGGRVGTDWADRRPGRRRLARVRRRLAPGPHHLDRRRAGPLAGHRRRRRRRADVHAC